MFLNVMTKTKKTVQEYVISKQATQFLGKYSTVLKGLLFSPFKAVKVSYLCFLLTKSSENILNARYFPIILSKRQR